MTTQRHIALLRGINVGGKNKLPMKDLVAMFEAHGCTDVATYIQSGNVVFRASAALAKRVPSAIAAAIEAKFGHLVPVVLRTHEQLVDLLATCPFPASAADRLHVYFLSGRPPAKALASLDPNHSPPDEIRTTTQELWLHCPAGIARSKFTNAWLDRKLGVVSTARNLATVRKLMELSGG